MSGRSSSHRREDSSRRRQESRREHTTERPQRQQTMTYVYTRIQGVRENEGGTATAGPSTQAPPVSFFQYQDSSDSGYSNRGQEILVGSALRSRELDERVGQWMQRLSIANPTSNVGQAGPPPGAAVRTSSSGPYRQGDPNTIPPSVAGSHFSGGSYPSQAASPERPSWDRPSFGEREPVVIRPPGYVPPERRAERQRANQEVVVENSERRRRRERRDEGRRRNR
ncbi:hypothetical protein F5Y05DRAFT_205569 [Hypoxylon sp. FL0543]|nr:hypothetical protein F5Y05DRAFT_205569 [Hypoxylon sp. FL0543]